MPRISLAVILFSLLALAPETASATSPTGSKSDAEAPWEGEPFAATPAALAKAADALPLRTGPVEILFEEGTYRFDERGAATFEYRLVSRPLDPGGVRALARIERTFSPWHETRPEVRARVVSPTGEVRELDPRTLTETDLGDGAVGRHSDRRAVVGPLPGVEVGSIIEEVTTVRDVSPAFEGGEVQHFYFGQAAPARKVRLRLQAPSSLPLRFVVRGAKILATENTSEGIRTVTFERRDVPVANRLEPAAPPELPPVPYVAFGWGRSWSDVARRYDALVDGQLRGADLETALADALGPRPRPSREESVRRIVRWVQENVRYTGIDFGESDVVPSAPGTTLAAKKGDARDVAALLLSMLRQAGFSAHIVLVSADWTELTKELPGLGELDHALLLVDGGPPLWIDATDPFSPPGRLPLGDQNKLALVVSPSSHDLVRTPASGASDNTALTSRDLYLAELGPGRIVETRTLTGALADSERSFRARAGPELDERYVRDVFHAAVFLGSEVKGKDGLGPLEVRIEADESKAVVTEDDQAEVPVTPDLVFQPLLDFFPHAERGSSLPTRTEDLVLPMPYRWEVLYRIHLPDGFRVRELPSGSTDRFGPATYVAKFEKSPDRTVLARFTFDTGARRIPAKEADRLIRRAFEMVVGGGPRVKVERTAAALFALGQVPEALSELARLRAAHPREAAHPLHFSLLLLQLGFGDAAVASAREGIALEPQRAWGYRVLGYVLEHDAVGRLHGAGFDRDGALAAYRKAKDLDPKHAGGRVALADLYLTAADGTRFGRGADFEAAIDEYRSLREDLGVKEQDGALLTALVGAGRLKEAIELGRAMPKSPDRNALLVAAIAGALGTDKAIAEADGLGDDRRDALRGAVPWLVRLQKFKSVATLLREASRGASDAAELRTQSDEFASVRPYPEVLKEGDAAARLLKRLFVVAVKTLDPEKDFAPLLSARVLESDLGPLLKTGLPLPVAAARQALRQTSISPDALLDILFARLEISREGDLATVLRARLRFPFSPAERGSTVYLVLEGGEPRLLATDLAWPILAEESLRRVATGDNATAAALITWAKEDAGADLDPSSPSAIISVLWSNAYTGGPRPPDAARIRLAATALLAFTDNKGTTLSPLQEAEASLAEGPERRAISLALLRAERAAGKPDLAIRTADEILAAEPTQRAAFVAKAWGLERLGKKNELTRAGATALSVLPNDPEVLSVLAGSKLLVGDLEGASRAWRSLIDSGQATPLAYNNAAWLELFLKPPGAVALDWARRAVEEDKERSHASLNTLAAVYAELGRPTEAREIFLRSVSDGRPLEGADWFVVGRIAEGFGLSAAAREAYAKVLPQPSDGVPDPTDARILADRRLAAMQMREANKIPDPASP